MTNTQRRAILEQVKQLTREGKHQAAVALFSLLNND